MSGILVVFWPLGDLVLECYPRNWTLRPLPAGFEEEGDLDFDLPRPLPFPLPLPLPLPRPLPFPLLLVFPRLEPREDALPVEETRRLEEWDCADR